MRRRIVVRGIFLVLILLAAVFAGCTSYETAQPTSTPTPTEDPMSHWELPPGIDPADLPFSLLPGNATQLTPSGSSSDLPTPTTDPGALMITQYIDSKGYSKREIIDYFEDIALHAEYGTNDNMVHKWGAPITVYVKGSPTWQDRQVLQDVFDRMNAVNGFPGIFETSQEASANLVIEFAYDRDYRNITPSNINDSTDGFASCWWQDSVIYKAKIGIRTSITQTERNSVIWEEMVQATGLQNDSYTYPESLFYQGYNEVQEPTTLDWLMFEVLYHPDIKAGMTPAECETLIGRILR